MNTNRADVKIKKLSIKRETVRSLTTEQLALVGGGSGSAGGGNWSCCHTKGCPV